MNYTKIPTHLIEKSVGLTETDFWDVCYCGDVVDEVSREYFCYYLLSPEFIDAFYYKADYPGLGNNRTDVSAHIGTAIYEYQSGNSEPLISLLSKI